MTRPTKEQYEIAAERVVKVIRRSKYPIQPSYAYAKACYDNPLDSVFLYWQSLRRTKHGLDPEVNKLLQKHPGVHPIKSPNGKVKAYVRGN